MKFQKNLHILVLCALVAFASCAKKKGAAEKDPGPDPSIKLTQTDPNSTVVTFPAGTSTCKAVFLFLQTLNEKYITEVKTDTIESLQGATEKFAADIIGNQFKIPIDDIDFKSIKKDDCTVFEKLAEKAKDKKILDVLEDENDFDPLEFVLNGVLFYYSLSYDMVSNFTGKYTGNYSGMDSATRWGLKFLFRPDYYKPYKEKKEDEIEARKPPYLFVEYSPEYLRSKLPKFTRIYKIGNKDVKDLSYNDAILSISKKTNLDLTIRTWDGKTYSDPKSVNVDFEQINEPHETSFQIIQSGDKPTIGYFHIPSFLGDKLDKDYLESWVEYMQTVSGKTAGVILDLRNNGGGSYYEMQKILGTIFPDPKTIVGHRKERNGKDYKLVTEKIQGAVPIDYGKIIVLTNYGSASASEIVASVIKDYKAGLIVGEPTIGKGIGQQKFFINEEHIQGYTALSNFYLFSPLGYSWYFKGIIPDIEVIEAANKDYSWRLEDRVKNLPPSLADKIDVSVDPNSIEVKNKLKPEVLEKLKAFRNIPANEPATCKKPASELAEEESCILSWGVLLMNEWIRLDPEVNPAS